MADEKKVTPLDSRRPRHYVELFCTFIPCMQLHAAVVVKGKRYHACPFCDEEAAVLLKEILR